MSVSRAELGMIANNTQIIDIKAKTVLKRKRQTGVNLIYSDTNIDQIYMSKLN